MEPTSRVRVYLLPLECASHQTCLDSYNRNLLRQRFQHNDNTATGLNSVVRFKWKGLSDTLPDRQQHDNLHTQKDPRKSGKSNKVYSCHICGKLLRSSIGLKSHIKVIHKYGDYLKHECAYCGKEYKNKSNLSQHIAKHMDIMKYACDICGKKYKYYSALYKHRKKHNRSRYKTLTCDHCSKLFVTKLDLQQHLRIHQQINKRFVCDLCGKGFPLPSYLDVHLISHSDKRNFRCDICGALLKRKSSLANHIHLVHGDKDHKCPHCGILFSTKSVLINHLPKTDVRAFKCHICLKTFKSASSLYHHMAIHQQDKLFKCKICYMTFTMKGGLQQHLKTHEEKTFKCQECNQRFRLQATLRRHIILIHQDTVKSFTCSLCEKSFKLKANLREHIMGVHSSGTYPCKYCGATFTYPRGVKRHMRRSCKVY